MENAKSILKTKEKKNNLKNHIKNKLKVSCEKRICNWRFCESANTGIV